MATGYYLLDNPQHPDYPQCGYPRRGGAKAAGTVILHDAEGGTDLVGDDMGAENVANYIRTRSTYGSYHRLVDRDTRIKMAPIDYETWHSVPDNPWSVGISVAWNKADLPRMTPRERRSYYVPLAREVLDVRAEFARRGIKVPIDRMLTAVETQARKPGISTHSRTDPSRRSDPFGTGSKYETEFLAVLAELGGKTITQEDPDMDATQATQLSETRALVGQLKELLGARVEDVGTEDGLTHGNAHERELIILRRIDARQLAQKVAPVNVDVDANEVAAALLEVLPKATATAVVNAMHTRLAQ